MGQCASTPLTSGDLPAEWQQQKNALAQGMAVRKHNEQENNAGRANYTTTADVGLNKGNTQYVFLRDNNKPPALQLDPIDEDASLVLQTSPAKHSLPPSAATPQRQHHTHTSTAIVPTASSPLKPEHWTKGELIGQGAFGSVYLGMDSDNGQLMAVKQVTLTGITSKKLAEHVRDVESEVDLYQHLDHPNIVRYLGTERTDDALNIFLEYVPGGSIASLLSKFGSFKESVVKVYTKQILQGLEYLHANSIIHRDIKGANILVDNTGLVKLADFGASKKIEDLVTIDSGFKSVKGTAYWMAPEVIKQSGHGRPADIWSVACTVIEMATGKPPWTQYGSQVSAMFHIASTKGPPPIPEHLSADCKDFLYLCFNRDWRQRPTANTLLQHPFLADVTLRTVAAPYNNLAGSNGLAAGTPSSTKSGTGGTAAGGWRESGGIGTSGIMKTPERLPRASSGGNGNGTSGVGLISPQHAQQQQANGMSPLGARRVAASPVRSSTKQQQKEQQGSQQQQQQRDQQRDKRYSDFHAVIDQQQQLQQQRGGSGGSPGKGVRASAPAAHFAGFLTSPTSNGNAGDHLVNDSSNRMVPPASKQQQQQQRQSIHNNNNTATADVESSLAATMVVEPATSTATTEVAGGCNSVPGTIDIESGSTATVSIPQQQQQYHNHRRMVSIDDTVSLASTAPIESYHSHEDNDYKLRPTTASLRGSVASEGQSGSQISAASGKSAFNPMEEPDTTNCNTNTFTNTWLRGSNEREGPGGRVSIPHDSSAVLLQQQPDSPSEASSVPRRRPHISRTSSKSHSLVNPVTFDADEDDCIVRTSTTTASSNASGRSGSGGNSTSSGSIQRRHQGPIVYTVDADDVEGLPWDTVVPAVPSVSMRGSQGGISVRRSHASTSSSGNGGCDVNIGSISFVNGTTGGVGIGRTTSSMSVSRSGSHSGGLDCLPPPIHPSTTTTTAAAVFSPRIPAVSRIPSPTKPQRQQLYSSTSSAPRKSQHIPAHRATTSSTAAAPQHNFSLSPSKLPTTMTSNAAGAPSPMKMMNSIQGSATPERGGGYASAHQAKQARMSMPAVASLAGYAAPSPMKKERMTPGKGLSSSVDMGGGMGSSGMTHSKRVGSGSAASNSPVKQHQHNKARAALFQ